MSSDFTDGDNSRLDTKAFDSVEYLLFDSLVHHLIEKGLLTKNDALSVVQTAAEVVRGQMHESDSRPRIDTALGALERTFASFEALPDRYARSGLNGDNVLPLRNPLHRNRPHFPSDDDAN